jgi:hypothetical protein
MSLVILWGMENRDRRETTMNRKREQRLAAALVFLQLTDGGLWNALSTSSGP